MATPYYPNEMGRWRSCVSWFLIIAGTGRTLCRKQFLLTTPVCMNRLDVPLTAWCSAGKQPRRPRGSQSGREKRRGGIFKYGRKSPWVPTATELFPKIQADSGSWLGTKSAFVLFCPIGEQFLPSLHRWLCRRIFATISVWLLAAFPWTNFDTKRINFF